MSEQIFHLDADRKERFRVAALRLAVRASLKSLFHPAIPLPLLRRGLQTFSRLSPGAPDVRCQQSRLGEINADRHLPPQPSGRIILWFHGGAYCMGSPVTHRTLAGHLALQASAEVWVPDYRLAPENPYPAAIDDALAAYQALLDEGIKPSLITLGGDSAGGGLVLALALRLRGMTLPMPASLLLVSPWADLEHPEKAHIPDDIDVMLSWDLLEKSADHYARGQRQEALVSPLQADLGGLPPALVVVGSDEILLPDARRIVASINQQGGLAALHLYQDMWHVFLAHAGMLRIADQAMARMAAFVCSHTATG